MKSENKDTFGNKFWNLINTLVFYSIRPKKKITNWIIFFSISILSWIPYFFIIKKSLSTEITLEILHWQAATFFLSNLLLPMNFSMIIMLLQMGAMLFLPMYVVTISYYNIIFILILLFIVFILTYAFNRLIEWDMERIRESVKLLEIKQNRINSLFDNEFYALVVHRNGTIQDINETFTTIFQYSLEEIKEANLFELLFKNNKDDKNKIISGKSDFNIETTAYRKSGNQIPIEIIGKKYEEEGEQLKICFIRDITLKKEMYQELTRHKNYLQKILDALPHAIFVKNIKTMEIQTANSIANKGMQHTGEGINYYAMDNSAEYERGLELVKKTKLPLTIEETHHGGNKDSIDGAENYFEIYIFPFLNEIGEIEQLLEIITDITARKKIEQRLKNTLKELRDMRDALDEHAIVSITDPEGNITYVNDKFVKVSGYSREELIGKNHRIIKSNEHTKEFYKSIWETITKGQIWQGEVKNRAKDGSLYWVSSTMVPFMDENHKPYQYVSIRTEITEQRRVTNQLKEAKEEAERANQAKSNFLANMSHEIRTPLNAVLGMADLAMTTELTPVQSKYLSLIRSSGENLLNIINEILDFSKIEADKFIAESYDFQLRQTLFTTLHIFLFQAKEKGLIMSSIINPNVPDFLIGDQQRIKQILINLVGNSLKFTDSGYILVDIDASNYDGISNEILIKFSVADSGIGIPVSKQKLIFESFTQEDSSTSRKYGGTGLGTTISKELTRKMGGDMGVFSPVRHYRFPKGGVGSEFWFTIKCRVNLAKEKEFTSELKKKNLHALISITEKNLQKTIETYFQSLYISCTNINLNDLENEKECISSNIQIIIIEMPEKTDQIMNILKNIQNSANISNATQIAVIIKDDPTFDTMMLYELGVAYFIYKPVSENSILRMLNYFMHENTEISNPLKKLVGEKDNIMVSKQAEIQQEKKQMHILIAEDNEINQFLLKTILENMGCSTVVASNGKEAVKTLRENGDVFDLVFMDIQMPEMNGFQATEEIRKSISTSIPIVAVSANAFKEDQDKSIELGMNDFIAKPYKKEDLVKIVQKYRELLSQA